MSEIDTTQPQALPGRTQRQDDDLDAVVTFVRAVATEASSLSRELTMGIRVWPGGALSAVGLIILILSFILKVVLYSSGFGVVEFSVSLIVGALLTLAGPLVITQNVAKADLTVDEFIQAAERRLKSSSSTSLT